MALYLARSIILTELRPLLVAFRIKSLRFYVGLVIVDQPTHEIKHIQAFYVNAKLLWDIYMSHNGG